MNLKRESLVFILGLAVLISSVFSIDPALSYHVANAYAESGVDPITAKMDSIVVPGDDVGVGPVVYGLVGLLFLVLVTMLIVILKLLKPDRIKMQYALGIGYFLLGLGLHVMLWIWH